MEPWSALRLISVVQRSAGSERPKTAYEHAWQIRDAYGYHPFEDLEWAGSSGSSGRSCFGGRGRGLRGRWRCSTRQSGGCAATGCCCRVSRCRPSRSARCAGWREKRRYAAGSPPRRLAAGVGGRRPRLTEDRAALAQQLYDARERPSSRSPTCSAWTGRRCTGTSTRPRPSRAAQEDRSHEVLTTTCGWCPSQDSGSLPSAHGRSRAGSPVPASAPEASGRGWPARSRRGRCPAPPPARRTGAATGGW